MTTRLEFRILGPLAVRTDGAAVPIGGPKQRALLALLLLSPNRVVARDRLVGELFAAQSVNSADHALRNQVSRLRKVLGLASAGEPRLTARAPGYLLRVEPGELDLERFEQLAAQGREALESGDPAAAADALRAAEALWCGRPLADLEFEPFARLEVERLEELRLAALEERIDAELALGRHLPLVPELEALSAEHPYRERFSAQLMLALYRCGRQVEGLGVYRRTRTLLDDELGLAPGTELQQLERAILVHDPALAAAADGRARPAPRVPAVCPFKGLAPFEAADAEFFFGRERLVDEIVAQLATTAFLAVIGPSGSGKSSLLRAGLLPALEHERLLVRPGDRPTAELVDAIQRVRPGERLVLAVDQFEELFAESVAEDERRAFVDALVEAAWDPDRRALILIVLRADFFGRLAPYVGLADLVGPNHVLLGPMTAAGLRRVIEGPAEAAGLEVEGALAEILVDDVAGVTGGLPLLSTALLDLWRERSGRSLTLAAYERTGGVRGAVRRHAEAGFRSLPAGEQEVARRILLRLVAGGDGEPLTRRRATREELDADDDERVALVLGVLVERRLLVADDGAVELVHEALLEQWPRLVGWVEEDAQGRRLHRHLSQAASEWEAAGRDPSELYRGARLAAALEWADASDNGAGLNRLERRFLTESRTAFARATRRLRALLALAVLLLVAAAIAGAVALQERGAARRQATSAIAQRLGAQALVEPRLDRALLLARKGVDLDDSLATQSNLFAALLRSPAALAVARGGGQRVLDDALSRDGRVLAVRGDDGSVTFFDVPTLREVGSILETIGQISYYGAIVRPVRALAFSPNGRTLAVGDSDGWHATLYLVDTRSHRARVSVTSPTNAVTADVAFAPDGRTVVTGEAVTGSTSPPAEVLVVRAATDGRVLRQSQPIAGGRLIGYTQGGRSLLVTSGETTSYLLNPRTFERVLTVHVSGTAAISPVGDTAAFGQDDGSVTLVSLGTGSKRSMDSRAPGRVTALAFRGDGTVLATGSDDGSVQVWDVPTGSLRETFSGHAAAARGLVFNPDGTTLYSGSSDGSVIAWDVRGDRRLGQPFRFDPVAEAGAGRQVSARKASTAVAVSPDSSLFVTSPAAGRVTIWRASDQAAVGELHGPSGHIESLAFSHDGRLVAATGDGSETVVWDVAARKVVKLLGPAGANGASGVNFSPDDKLLGTAGIDGMLRVYELSTNRSIGSMLVSGSLQDLDFSSDGKLVAAAGLAGEIAIWNVARRTPERVIRHHNAILSIRFSPDGKEIATGDLPGNVEFWRPVTGRHVGPTLGGHNGLVLSVTFNRSGTRVITTSTDGKLRLWDRESGRLVGAPIRGGDTGGWGTFFPDGRRVIAVFRSGTGVLWNVDAAAWIDRACRVAHRNLTRTEWRNFLPERGYGRVCGTAGSTSLG
ncbi:MAG: winged helix-turn-helix domain-containing protein [Actinobacteria bacterium]|nr:winged helix-turn-helix domain-containing protein [Actinomycetota bacterium]